ncbi:Emopamil-binding protein [Thelephora terrestris]|uniref:Emopamil-binding protein n=1 Tax=Thelephora terrestris TaxID=56493 RepID=A0A9P6L5F7_9AGAM|nr:Emopamil-binding protein [Thelephora terrestris]
MTDTTSAFTATSAFSIAGVFGALAFAYFGLAKLLPKTASRTDKFTFVWLAFDALIHFTYEGPWLYFSTFGRTVNGSVGPLAEMWKEYANVDFRWGTADPIVVSIEILTVLGAGPLCCYIISQLIRNDPARHFWIIVLSTAELYGGWMTFCPEWVSGNPNLDTSKAWAFWVYLVFMNTIWVWVPLWLMWDSYHAIAGSLRLSNKTKLA